MRLVIAKKSVICVLWTTLQSTFVFTHDTSNFTKLLLEQPESYVDKSLIVKAFLEDKNPIISILRPKLWGKTLNLDTVRKFLQIEVDSEGIILPRPSQTSRKFFTGFEIKSEVKHDSAKIPKVTATSLPVKTTSISHVKLPPKSKVTIRPAPFSTEMGIAPPPKPVKVPPLKISTVSEAMEHQGIYPVIWLDLENSQFSMYSKMEDYLKQMVKAIFEEYPYLQDYTKDQGEKDRLLGYLTANVTAEQLSDSIRFLSELLYKHFNRKVYVLVNDYNKPFNLRAVFPQGESIAYEKVVNLLRNLFCSTFNDNPYVQKGIFSATIPSSEAYSSVFRHLNKFTEYTLLDTEFSEYYGFTQSEVDDLINRTPPQFVQIDPVEIRNLYEGYNHGHQIIYNPSSVIGRIQFGVNHIPWLQCNTLPHQSVDFQLSKNSRLQAIRDLVSGYGVVSTIEAEISYQNISDASLYSALLFAGYLNAIPVEKSNSTYRLTIPNEEIKEFYARKIRNWLRNKLAIDVTVTSNFVNMLPIGLVDGFKAGYQKLISGLAVKLQKLEGTEVELVHHDLMLLLIDSLSPNYQITYQKFPSTRETVVTAVPRVEHMHNVIFIGYKIVEDSHNLTSVANGTLQHVNRLQFDPKHANGIEIQSIIKIGIAICKWYTAVLHRVESVS